MKRFSVTIFLSAVLCLAFVALPVELRADEEKVPMGCALPGEHDGPPQAPHLQDSDDADHENDQCHGAEGDRGSCSIFSDTTDDGAHVTCFDLSSPSGDVAWGCLGRIVCGPSAPVVSCGGEGYEAFAGIHTSGPNAGKAYYACRKGASFTQSTCP